MHTSTIISYEPPTGAPLGFGHSARQVPVAVLKRECSKLSRFEVASIITLEKDYALKKATPQVGPLRRPSWEDAAAHDDYKVKADCLMEDNLKVEEEEEPSGLDFSFSKDSQSQYVQNVSYDQIENRFVGSKREQNECASPLSPFKHSQDDARDEEAEEGEEEKKEEVRHTQQI